MSNMNTATEEHATTKQNNVLIRNLTNKLLQLIGQELAKNDSQQVIKRNIIIPVINMMYNELYPYIITFVLTITLIMIFSLSTFICFILYYFKK